MHNVGDKEKLSSTISKIKRAYPEVLNADLDLISEAVKILGDESLETKRQKAEEMKELANAISETLEELVQGHFENFNYMIASINPFSV